MPASSEFLSHPKEEKKLLKDHLLEVARSAREIIASTKFRPEPAYYAGLLHDVGKLNPFYQKVFNADEKERPSLEEQLLKEYERQHSLFSAWAAYHLLRTKDSWTRSIVVALIAGHHSRLTRTIKTETNNLRQKTQKAIAPSIPKFKQEVSSERAFSDLCWEECERCFGRPMSFQFVVLRGTGDEELGVSSFLEASAIFSAFLQADRGSFEKWRSPVYDIRIDTSSLIGPSTTLGGLRSRFQRKVHEEYRPDERISVIQAPTGMGKTKLFLDLIPRHQGLERVIYFSPLLALTEDFEDKLKAAVKDPEDVLVYNHLFSGPLKKKHEGSEREADSWNFLNESFNSKFIVTTMQRLLLTLYSNTASDKLKLISLKNSLLVIDEIQVIPKFLLPNLISILREVCNKMNSRVLLVSATIPHEIKEAQLPTYGMPETASQEYHERTLRMVEFDDSLNLPASFSGRVLLMANTRRKARELFDSIRQKAEVYYLTTGIKKKDRSNILELIKKSEECVVVSTQVIEAGVNINFSQIYREAAPLDSVIQVMGRLNREGDNHASTLHIFRTDQDHRPYSELEYEKSLRILENVHTSKEIYEELDRYYDIVSSRNLAYKVYSDTLFRYERDMDFQGAWDFVRKHVLEGQDEYPVLIPDSDEELDRLRKDLLATERADRDLFRRYGSLTASLQRGHLNKLQEFFDQEVMEKRGILLPMRGKLRELYDGKVGLDKWLT